MVEEFRLGIGGPLYRVERATHLDALGRLIVAAIGVTWVPLLLLSFAEWSLGRRGDSMFVDLSIHARLVVTLPLLLCAERLFDGACRNAVARLFGEGFIPPQQHGRARAILQSAVRWRDSPAPETIFLALALAAGVASLIGILPPAGLVHGVTESRHSAVRVWYALISLPIFQLVLWRSLFRWALWARVLGGVSRLPLRLLPMHADRRGGIGFLKWPTLAYCTVLILAVSSALSGGFATQILLYGTKVETFKPLFLAFLVVGALIAFAPLLAFVPMLFVASRRARNSYGALVSNYSRQFDERWIEKAPPPNLLGNSDFQALADLSTSYRENVEKMQLFLFDLRDGAVLFIASQIPALPILLSQQATRDVLKQLLHLVGGRA